MSTLKDYGLKNHKLIYKYLKGKHGKRIGVLLGCIKEDEKFGIGWSLCHKKDRFDRDKAVKIAFGRAMKDSTQFFPHIIRHEYSKFATRCSKYFKDREDAHPDVARDCLNQEVMGDHLNQQDKI